MTTPNPYPKENREPDARSSRVQHFLRSIGLEVLYLTQFRRKSIQNSGEFAKPVFQTSLSIALARCCVHILPALTSVTIISINLAHLYLGRTIPGGVLDNTVTIAIFQIVAKAQELLIIASLTTLVFQVIRHQLTTGDGVPLGFLGSGFMFSSINYLWSSEFSGALRAQVSPRAKASLAALLIFSGLIAATAGPSCAVLLIPRDQDWNAGGSDFYLRGSPEEIYPNNLTSTPQLDNLCANDQIIDRALCPSGGFYSLWAYSSYLPMVYDSPDLRPKSSGLYVGYDITIASTLPAVPEYNLQGSFRGMGCQTVVIGPHLPTIMYQRQIMDDWLKTVEDIPWDPLKIWTASSAEYKWFGGYQFNTATRIPAVRVACSEAQNISTSGRTVSFPTLQQNTCWQNSSSFEVSALNSTPTPHIRTTWIQLPPVFGSVSTGLILEAPWVENEESRIVVGCSIDASWVQNNNLGFWSDDSGYPSDTPIEQWDLVKGLVGIIAPTNSGSDSSDSQILLDENWLNILTPKIGSETNGNDTWMPTTLELLLTRSALIDNDLSNSTNQTATWNNVGNGTPNRTVYLEWMVSLLVADGLSRHGSAEALNASGPQSTWNLLDYKKTQDFPSQLLQGQQALQKPSITNFTTLKMNIIIQGFSYQASSATDFLSMAVLLAHLVLALGHTIYLLIWRKSSGCWDTIPELLTLAQNSRPAHSALRHTSTGIKNLHTYAQVAKVRATRPLNTDIECGNSSPMHVELIFNEEHVPSEACPSPTSDDRARLVASAATWLAHKSNPSSSSIDTFSAFGGSAHNSDTVLLKKWKGTSPTQQDFSTVSLYGPASHEHEEIHPDRLYG